jgi:alanine racemase
MTTNDHAQPAAPYPYAASWVNVDLGAVSHNLRALRALLAPTDALAVVKANAYGHGAAPVARAAVAGGARGLAVACLAEGAELRAAGLTAPILLLNAGNPEEAEEIVRLGLTQALCTLPMAHALSAAAGKPGRLARAHLKLDTGMGRLGLAPEQVGKFAEAVRALPGLQVEGVFSHLATAEDENTDYAQEQFARFRTALATLEGYGLPLSLRHFANSAATLRFPEMRLDAVRAGLLVYGLTPEAPGLAPLDLRPALSWVTRVAFLRPLAAGRSVSYARTHVLSQESLVGVLPIGYADGFPRTASNRAHVLVRGRLCPIIGTVCMDHVMVNLTPAGDIPAGEEAVIVGAQQGARITVNQLAGWAGTVVHEITTRLGPRVARRYSGGE